VDYFRFEWMTSSILDTCIPKGTRDQFEMKELEGGAKTKRTNW
jgi:hypothetical protein